MQEKRKRERTAKHTTVTGKSRKKRDIEEEEVSERDIDDVTVTLDFAKSSLFPSPSNDTHSRSFSSHKRQDGITVIDEARGQVKGKFMTSIEHRTREEEETIFVG